MSAAGGAGDLIAAGGGPGSIQAIAAVFPRRPLRLRQSGLVAMCWIVPAALLVLPPGLVLYQLVDLLAKPPADAWRPLVFAAALLFAGLVEWGGLRAWRLLREQQRFLDSLSGQPLSPVALNAVRIEPSGWTLERAAGGERFRWLVPRTADLPFTINRERRQVLGVTAEGVPHPMPLDGRLRWVGLTEAERLSLLAMRG